MAQFTTLIITALNDLKNVYPEMSFGELLYSILRRENLPAKPEDVNTSWLLSLKDSDIYNSIEQIIKTEQE